MTFERLRAQVIPANEYRRERWRNGLGWTRRIAAWPDADAWQWRLSIAEIERPAPFSAFPGVDREQVLLAGAGLRLRFDDGDERLLSPPCGSACYPGERALTGEPVDGRVEVFNLLWRRDSMQAQLWRRPLVGPMLFFADRRECWALHLLAGQARFDPDAGLPAMAQGDTALLAAPERRRFLLDGGGELLAMRLRARG
ncbi:HutD/Ves family protein [Luteimonas suaedae]|uniref:HutD/Ves family protein n=1 Tax=Luteimonas suaedae TaxID=2605430 RepID=UPI0011EFBA85|nr:HutD family protein [Luteimonas suaedae]